MSTYIQIGGPARVGKTTIATEIRQYFACKSMRFHDFSLDAYTSCEREAGRLMTFKQASLLRQNGNLGEIARHLANLAVPRNCDLGGEYHKMTCARISADIVRARDIVTQYHAHGYAQWLLNHGENVIADGLYWPLPPEETPDADKAIEIYIVRSELDITTEIKTLRNICEQQPDRWLGKRYTAEGESALEAFAYEQLAWSECLVQECDKYDRRYIDVATYDDFSLAAIDACNYVKSACTHMYTI